MSHRSLFIPMFRPPSSPSVKGFLTSAISSLSFLFLASPAPAETQLFLDTRVVAATENAELVIGTVEKDAANPLFQADKPWEDSLDNLYANLIFDEEDQRFKLWYATLIVTEEGQRRMTVPNGLPSPHPQRYNLYAESVDGIRWEKPELGLVPYDGSAANNILTYDAANTGVFKDLRESDPARRYKMVLDHGRGNLFRRFSADGIHWSVKEPMFGFNRNGDTHNNAFWDSRGQRYVCITRIFPGSRMVARTESADFLHWTDPTIAVLANGAEGARRQHYCMTAFPYEGIYLGFLMMYNRARDKTVDCELAWSPDTVTWHRIQPGRSLIPRGPAGSYDAGCVYAQANGPIRRDGRLWIYYGGCDKVHDGQRHSLLCLARLRLDGFAGYAPRDRQKPAMVLTAPMRRENAPLRINADATNGTVRVTVRDLQSGWALPCAPVRGDVTNHLLTSATATALPDLAGRVVQLQFELEDATLYSLRGLVRLPVPVITPQGPFRFAAKTTVSMAAPEGSAGTIHYTRDGSDPDRASPAYERPFEITRDTTVRARLFAAKPTPGEQHHPLTRAQFLHYCNDRTTESIPATPVEYVASFDTDAENWTHGLRRSGVGNFVRNVEQGKGLLEVAQPAESPMASAMATASGGVFTGDLPARYGGSGVTLSCRVRTTEPGQKVFFRICGLVKAGWQRTDMPLTGRGWTTLTATVRYDWTDEEARAAGWEPNVYAMPFAESLRHVFMPRIVSDQSAFELDEFRMTTATE